jgi:hypothetical protein
MVIDFNRGWMFSKEGCSPAEVNLPHDAMLTERRSFDCVNGLNSGYFPGGKYRYEKSFTLKEVELQKSIKLFFEGVYHNCAVLLNGEEIGRHKYGYTEFTVDLTDKARAGENTVTVDVDNSLEPNCRWYSGGGIYRPVSLIVNDRAHISSVRIETRSYSPAVIFVSVITTRDEKTAIEIYDADDCIVSGEPGLITIPNAKLWNTDNPHLYTCVVKTASDEQRINFGIRMLEWNAKSGLLINGKEILRRGGCIHHDNGILGACAFADAEYRKIRIMKEAGYNAVRSAHNPCSRAMLDACDKLGMLIIDEAFDGWYIPKTCHDYSRWFNEEHLDDLRAMVEKDINHPSVIIYSIGNEVSETASQKGVDTCKELADYVRSIDSTRPVTCGINVLLNIFNKAGIGIYKEKNHYTAEPLPLIKKKRKEKKSGSSFFNAVIQKLGPFMFIISKGKRGDNVTKGAAEWLDILGLNYAASRYEIDAAAYPQRLMVGTETMAAELPYNWERVVKYKSLIGDFVWAAFDYLGEAGIGDWTYYSYPGKQLLAGSGTIDITGIIGAEACFEQTVWGLRDKPYIGVRPLNHSGEVPFKSAWRFTDALDSWNWPGFEGRKAFIEVYSDAYAVRLLLNGKIIGEKRISKYKAVFRTRYAPGKLTAIALNKSGEPVAENSLQTGGGKTALRALADKPLLAANGQDLCYIMIEFTDGTGRLLPSIEQRVDINVAGTAALQGFGSGLCKTDEIFDKSYHNSYRGRALAVIRAGYQKENARVTVSSEGMESVTLDLEVR